MNSVTDTKVIEETIRAFVQKWNDLDLMGLMECWDNTPDCSYIATELDQVLIGWSDIADHLSRTRSRLVSADVGVSQLWIRSASSDIAIAIFLIEWRLRSVEFPIPRRSHTRVTAVLRETGNEWRFIHYMEEPYHLSDNNEVQTTS